MEICVDCICFCYRIDSNSNGFVSVDELRNWIIFKVKEHLQSALRENIFLFTSIDAEVKDGRVSWKEYQTWFLKNRAGNNTGKNTELDRNIKGIELPFLL